MESRPSARGPGEGGRRRGRLEAPWPEPPREVVVYTEDRDRRGEGFGEVSFWKCVGQTILGGMHTLRVRSSIQVFVRYTTAALECETQVNLHFFHFQWTLCKYLISLSVS